VFSIHTCDIIPKSKLDGPDLFRQSYVQFEELDDSGMKLFARVFVAQFDAERVDLVRLLLVAPVQLQLRLPVTILPARTEFLTITAKHDNHFIAIRQVAIAQPRGVFQRFCRLVASSTIEICT